MKPRLLTAQRSQLHSKLSPVSPESKRLLFHARWTDLYLAWHRLQQMHTRILMQASSLQKMPGKTVRLGAVMNGILGKPGDGIDNSAELFVICLLLTVFSS